MINKRYGYNPAELKHRITFLKPPSVTGGGFPNGEWTKHVTVWASIVTQKGRRLFNSDAVQMQGTKIFGIRYRSGLNDTMRIRYKDKLYDIESMENDDENNQWYTILVREVL